MSPPVAIQAIDIVSIGEPMIEFNQTSPGELRYLQGFGGDSSNMIIAAARSGARTAYVTRVGDDEFGRMFRALWAAEGVDTRGVATDPQGHTAVYFVSHGPQGHVFSYLRAGSAASRTRPEDLPLDLVRSARFVHASGIGMAISSSACDAVLAAFDAGRSAGAKISFDSNLRLKLWPLARARATIGAAAAMTDYFFPSARRERIAGHRVNAVDATGAGDCFCGTALARLAAGDSLFDAARYANAAAALATTGFGAVAPLPRPDAVRKLLRA